MTDRTDRLVGSVQSVQIDVGRLGPGFEVRIGSAVKLDMDAVDALCIRASAADLGVFRGRPGVVTRTYRPDGWPLMCEVDFGTAGCFHGPVTMLQSAYADA